MARSRVLSKTGKSAKTKVSARSTTVATKKAAKPSRSVKAAALKKTPSKKTTVATKTATTKKSAPAASQRTAKQRGTAAASEKRRAKPTTSRTAKRERRPSAALRRGPAILSERERNAYLENLIATVSEESHREHERLVEVAKFDIGVSHDTHIRKPVLPAYYGLDRVILLVVDPRFVFTYWEVTPEAMDEAAKHIGPHPKLTLRFYDTSDGLAPEQSPSWDIEVFDRLGNWYLRLEHPNQTLVIDIGLKDAAGRFCAITRSNYMKLPRDAMAAPGPLKWMVVGPDGERLVTDVEEYTEADHELLKRILGPYFYRLLMEGQFASIMGSSMEAVFQDISMLKHPEIMPSSSPTAWLSEQHNK